MRRSGLIIVRLLPVLLLCTPGHALGRDTCSVSKDPQFDGATLKIECTSGVTISKYIEDSLCGGSDKETSVVGNTGDEKEDKDRYPFGKDSYIAEVDGLPGRLGYPLGDVLSGMAKREDKGGRYDDGFSFPQQAEGMSTACIPKTERMDHPVFHCSDGQIVPMGSTCAETSADGTDTGRRFNEPYGYPYFEDPPCRWRFTAKGKSTYNPLITASTNYSKNDFSEIDNGQTPELCTGLCSQLNDWQYWDCLESEDNTSVNNGMPLYCLRYGWRFICNDEDAGTDNQKCEMGKEIFGALPNASPCSGEEDCRCSGIEKEKWCPRTGIPPDEVSDGLMPYRSYFRQYNASFLRKALDKYVKDDKAKEEKIPVACYGFYDEFDPRYQRTTKGDARCVIDLNDVEKRKDTQKGIGKTSAQQIKTDPPEPKKFDEKKDDWWTIFAAGFAHLSPKQKDLSEAMSDVADAKTKAIAQTDKPDENLGFSETATLRDFDDTGPLRTIVRWWHEQETAANTLLTPPTFRLVHIPAWAIGLGKDEPILQGTSSSASGKKKEDDFSGLRESPIDIQIHAREDRIGEILAYIDRTLLTVEEVELPIVVPVGSPTEFRARAQGLCASYQVTHPGKDCKTGKLGETMTRLEEYANRIEQSRILRSELAAVSGQLLKAQLHLLEPLHEWSKDNLDTYDKYIEKRKELMSLSAQWKTVQRVFTNFHEKTNMPWCRNDRYTIAIYSLLDPWMPTRYDRGSAYARVSGMNTDQPGTMRGDPDERPPTFLEILANEIGKVGGDGEVSTPDMAKDLPSLIDVLTNTGSDIVMDLTAFNGLHGPMKIPTLTVTQVLLDLDDYLPPPQGQEYTKDAPPPLPPIEDIKKTLKDIKDVIPELCAPKTKEQKKKEEEAKKAKEEGKTTSEAPEEGEGCIKGFLPPDVKAPPLRSDDETAEIAGKMSEIETVLKGMDEAYQKFWDGINPQDDQDLEKKKDLLKCPEWYSLPCVYNEMELMQEMIRIAARPAVLLKEDFDSHGALRGASTSCLPDDSVCLLLNSEETMPKTGWQIGSASSSSEKTQSKKTAEELRTKLRDASLPKPVGSIDPKTFPPYIANPEDLMKIFSVPDPIELSPKRSSSAGSK